MVNKTRGRFLVIVLFGFFIGFGCVGSSQATKDESQAEQSQKPSWDNQIDGSSYQLSQQQLSQSSYTSYADRIGAGQIDQLVLAGPSSAHKVVRYLTDPSEAVRTKAVSVLFEFGSKAQSALPAVITVLSHNNPEFRLSATQALWAIGSAQSEDALEKALDDPAPAVVAWAHAGLVRLGADCTDHLEDTAAILRDNAGKTSLRAAGAMSVMRCFDEDVVEMLVETIRSADPDQRAAAAMALGNLGPKAHAAVPELIGLLGADQAPNARLAALLALAKFGPQAAAAVAPLTELLRAPAARVRELSAHALGQIGPKAQAAMSALRQAALDSEPAVQAAAKNAIQMIEKS